MVPLPTFWRSLTCAAILLVCALLGIQTAHGQQQEAGILTKVKQGGSANRESFAFAGADKSFGTASAAGGRTATVKPYNFGGKSSVFGGDGQFRTKSFNNPKADGFGAGTFATKPSSVSQRNSFAQSDRTFATKTMDVREAPAANKTMAVRAYAPANTTYYGRGKRQDYLDERTQSAKNLSIDEVRSLLNKGPTAKSGTVLEPVVPTVR